MRLVSTIYAYISMPSNFVYINLSKNIYSHSYFLSLTTLLEEGRSHGASTAKLAIQIDLSMISVLNNARVLIVWCCWTMDGELVTQLQVS